MNIDTCIAEGHLKRVKPDKDIQHKEITSAEYDLERAISSMEAEDYKWTTIQAYYAVFHAARALLNKNGYREKRHFAVGVVLEELTKNSSLDTKLVSDFHAAMSAREDADYRDLYSKETADYLVEVAQDFVKNVKRSIR